MDIDFYLVDNDYIQFLKQYELKNRGIYLRSQTFTIIAEKNSFTEQFCKITESITSFPFHIM